MKNISIIIMLFTTLTVYSQTENNEVESAPLYKRGGKQSRTFVNEPDSVVKSPLFSRTLNKEEVERIQAERKRSKEGSKNNSGVVNYSEQKKERNVQPEY